MIKSNDREIVLFHDTMKVALALPGAGINRSPVIDRSGYIRSILVKRTANGKNSVPILYM